MALHMRWKCHDYLFVLCLFILQFVIEYQYQSVSIAISITVAIIIAYIVYSKKRKKQKFHACCVEQVYSIIIVWDINTLIYHIL